MIRKNIPDIRLLRSTVPAVLEQMEDLSPYRTLSAMPAVVRDLSIVSDAEDDIDAIGDRVRECLGAGADIVETVEIRSEPPYDALPEPPRLRLGIRAGQKNLLLRVVLRALGRSLTNDECNPYRDTGSGDLQGERPAGRDVCRDVQRRLFD